MGIWWVFTDEILLLPSLFVPQIVLLATLWARNVQPENDLKLAQKR
jgi:hypothetical protein